MEQETEQKTAIWAVFKRETGAFAGSGTPYFDNDVFGSTKVLPLYSLAFWDEVAQNWTYPPQPPDDGV
jgi:hypothetical protein